MLPRFNKAQLDRLSEILGNLALIFFSTLVLPVFTKDFHIDVPLSLTGVLLGGGCVVLSVTLLKGGKI